MTKRFIPHNNFVLIKNSEHSYIIFIIDLNRGFVYKILFGNYISCKIVTPKCQSIFYICNETQYLNIKYAFNCDMLKNIEGLNKFFTNYKPIYYNRFKYVGKGFKLIIKRKQNFLNSIFGYSHIYWATIKQFFLKKTRKYKFFFATYDLNVYLNTSLMLKKIKSINRYTLRGLRTYDRKWVKRKGRKSVATHI